MTTETSIIPPDDSKRNLALARPNEDQNLHHIGLAGDTYTILLTGKETAGRYCLIDMLVPPGGGPPPHRHDFEEMFSILEGEIEVTFRGVKSVVRAGETANIPANAPLFMAVGILVASRTAPPPKLDEDTQAALKAKAEALAPHYRTEFLPPQLQRPHRLTNP